MGKTKPPVGYDDNPEWTEKDFARARKAGEIHAPQIAAALVRKAGRPAGALAAQRKEQVTVRLDSAILDKLKSGGPGWQTRMNDTLRKALGV